MLVPIRRGSQTRGEPSYSCRCGVEHDLAGQQRCIHAVETGRPHGRMQNHVADHTCDGNAEDVHQHLAKAQLPSNTRLGLHA